MLRTPIVGVEGEHVDHLTTTKAQQYQLPITNEQLSGQLLVQNID